MLISFGEWTADPGVCLLITLPAYKAGASRDSEQPSKEVAGGGAMHAVSFCRIHLYAWVCCWVWVHVCFCRRVHARFCVRQES